MVYKSLIANYASINTDILNSIILIFLTVFLLKILLNVLLLVDQCLLDYCKEDLTHFCGRFLLNGGLNRCYIPSALFFVRWSVVLLRSIQLIRKRLSFEKHKLNHERTRDDGLLLFSPLSSELFLRNSIEST